MTKLIYNLLQRDVTVGLSAEAREVQNMQEGKYLKHFLRPVLSQRSLTVQFYALLNEWKEDTKFLSFTPQICMHPAYLRIIGLGRRVIPCILRELERESLPWDWALTALTGEDPVLPEHKGNFDKMAEDWLSWAKNKDYGW